MADPYNNSLNSLLGSFTYTSTDFVGSSNGDNFIESICIDTSRNRIGINTLDPEYTIHIKDGNNGTQDYSGNLYVSEISCLSANINKLNINHIDASIIDLSSIIFKDTISGPTLDVSSIININTISGINLLFDVSKIDISGTIDLSYAQFKPKFFIPDSSANLEKYQLYYDKSGSDAGILMIKLS